jgi:hypothetical protein
MDDKTKKKYYISGDGSSRQIWEVLDDNFTPYHVKSARIRIQSKIPEGKIKVSDEAGRSFEVKDTQPLVKNLNKEKLQEMNRQLTSVGSPYIDIADPSTYSGKLKKLSEAETSKLTKGETLGSMISSMEKYKMAVTRTPKKGKKGKAGQDIVEVPTNVMISSNVKILGSEKIGGVLESLTSKKQSIEKVIKGERFTWIRTESLGPDKWVKKGRMEATLKGEIITGYDSYFRRMIGVGADPAITQGRMPAGVIITPMYSKNTPFHLIKETYTEPTKGKVSKFAKTDAYSRLEEIATGMGEVALTRFKEIIVTKYYANVLKDTITTSKIKRIAGAKTDASTDMYLGEYGRIVDIIKKKKIIREASKKDFHAWFKLKGRSKGDILSKRIGIISIKYDLPPELGDTFGRRPLLSKKQYFKQVVDPLSPGSKTNIFSRYIQRLVGRTVTTEENHPKSILFYVKALKELKDEIGEENMKKSQLKELDRYGGRAQTADEWELGKMGDQSSGMLEKSIRLRKDIKRKITSEEDYKGNTEWDSNLKKFVPISKEKIDEHIKQDVARITKYPSDADVYQSIKAMVFKKAGLTTETLPSSHQLAPFAKILDESTSGKKVIKASDVTKAFITYDKAYAAGEIKSAGVIASLTTKKGAESLKYEPKYGPRVSEATGRSMTSAITRYMERSYKQDKKQPVVGTAIGTVPLGQTLLSSLDSFTAGPEAGTIDFPPRAHAQESVLDEAISSVQSTLAGIVKGNTNIATKNLAIDNNMVSLQGMFNPEVVTGMLQKPQTFTSLITSPLMSFTQETPTKTVLAQPLAFAIARLQGHLQRLDISRVNPAGQRAVPVSRLHVQGIEPKPRVLPPFLALPPGFNIGDPSKRNKKRFLKKKTKKTWWQTPENWYEPYYWGGKDQLGAGYITFKGAEPAKVKRYEKKFFGIGVGF